MSLRKQSADTPYLRGLSADTFCGRSEARVWPSAAICGLLRPSADPAPHTSREASAAVLPPLGGNGRPQMHGDSRFTGEAVST